MSKASKPGVNKIQSVAVVKVNNNANLTQIAESNTNQKTLFSLDKLLNEKLMEDQGKMNDSLTKQKISGTAIKNENMIATKEDIMDKMTANTIIKQMEKAENGTYQLDKTDTR